MLRAPDSTVTDSRAAAPAAALELIVAMSQNDVIGRGNQLPWRLPCDLKHFRSLTLGKPVLMGRKTYLSIGKALPGRTNIVMTRSAEFKAPDCVIVDGLDAARALVDPSTSLMVIGGAEIYTLCLPHASRMHLTLVHAHIEDGDTFFAGWRDVQWRESSRERHEADDRNQFACSFVTLERARDPTAIR